MGAGADTTRRSRPIEDVPVDWERLEQVSRPVHEVVVDLALAEAMDPTEPPTKVP